MIQKIDYKALQTKLNENKVTAIIDCYTDWCKYCVLLAPVLDELSKEMEGKIEFCKINTDENPDFAREYEVMSLPTILFIKEGKIVEKKAGFMPKEAIMEIINSKMLDTATVN